MVLKNLKKLKKKEKKNQSVANLICLLLRHHDYFLYFPKPVKTNEMHLQESIWKQICEQNDWTYPGLNE